MSGYLVMQTSDQLWSSSGDRLTTSKIYFEVLGKEFAHLLFIISLRNSATVFRSLFNQKEKLLRKPLRYI